MRDHELELLAALAEGRLEDESEARALIASSPEARAEYEAQRSALEALSELDSVFLSEQERAELHRDVWTALRAPAEIGPSRGRWFSRWVPVTAGLFILVGVVAVLNQTDMLDGGTDSAQQSGAEIAATATTAFAETAGALGDLGDDTRDGDATEEAPNEDETSGTTHALASPTNSQLAFYSSEAEAIRSGDDDISSVELFDYPGTDLDLRSCLDDADLNGYVVQGVYKARSATVDETTVEPSGAPDGPFLVSIPAGADLRTAPLAFVDLENCETVYVDE